MRLFAELYSTRTGPPSAIHMRILFLVNSNEFVPNPDGSPLRAELVQSELASEFQDVEVVAKAAWPTSKLPGVLGGWIEEHRPDIVYINVAEYWSLYESVPLRVQRVFGKLGSPFAKLGLKAADTPWVAHNRFFRTSQRIAQRVIGGDPHFSTDEVVERVMACAHVALRREGTVVVVDGQRGRRKFASTRRSLRRMERRRLEVHRRLQAECGRLHVTYESDETPQWVTVERTTLAFQKDGFHLGRTAQEHMAQESCELIRRALLEADGVRE